MKVPQGQPGITRRFNAGLTSPNHVKSRRDGRKHFSHRRMSGRPCGTFFISSRSPTVETAGYCHAPLRGCTEADMSALIAQKFALSFAGIHD
jgi:hypothetical protein